jgi:hypothetical protein
MAASRLQRWAIILAAYSYTIEHIPTKERAQKCRLSFKTTHRKWSCFLEGSKPAFSCAQGSTISTRKYSYFSRYNSQSNWERPHSTKSCSKDDERMTKIDKECLKRASALFRSTCLQNGCLLCRPKVIIPTILREQVLTEIYQGHTGIVRMKAVARMHVWWPDIDWEIESCVYECNDCQRNSRNPSRAPVHPCGKAWKRLHIAIDFAGPFYNSMWLIHDFS